MIFFHFEPGQGGGSKRSGLTGSPDLPEPPISQPKSLRERVETIRRAAGGTVAALPRVLGLVWEASPKLTIGLGAATVLYGMTPALTALTGKLLINSVVKAIQVHATPGLADQTILAVPFPFVTIQSPLLTTTGAIIALAVVQFCIYALNSLLSTVRNITQQLLQEKVTLQIQLMVMDHAASLDLAFFEDSASYDLLRRAQNEASTRPLSMVNGAFGLIQTAITFTTMVALLIGVSPLLALIALTSPIPAFVADTRFGWRGFNLARWASPVRRRMDYLTSLVTTDTFAKEVKLFGLGGFFVERFRLLANTYYSRQRRLVSTRYLVGFLWSSLTTLAGSVTYLYIALQAVADRLTLGDLTLYTQAASSVQGSIQGLLSGFSGMYEHNLYLSNLYGLLETPVRITAPEQPRALPQPLRGEITFDHVSFSYTGSGAQALRDVSFRISAGETIAVVGRNGAGKTTLVKLICRLYDPSAGRIFLDGIDIREFDPDDLRRVVGAMFQDYVTYQATAAENIGLGDLDNLESQLAVKEAAEKAGADELISRLADGFDTPLGRWFDGGANLSGGEWQKVALGRAFMRDARILILDEPTSALDAQAEYELFARLRQLSEGRTAIYISHRFSTVRQADRILFLETGELVEEGTHEELMALGARYAHLFNLQAAAYLGGVVSDEDLAPVPASAQSVGGLPPRHHP